MVGFDVGATTITLSTGTRIPLEMRIPQDLTMRVAQNRPCISLDDGELAMQTSDAVYADAVADAINRGQNEPQSEIALAVPGWWTPTTVDRVRQAIVERGLSVHTVNEAEAAVADQQLTTPNMPDTVIVVSLRAAQSSAVIVQHCGARPRAFLSPTFVLEEGGNQLDAAVLRHLASGLNDLGSEVDASDPETIAAATLALSQCSDARERLSFTTTESVALMLTSTTHPLRLVRSELEEISRPWVDSVVHSVIEALELCDERVGAVLLTGGLAAMPLVSQRLSAELGLEVIVPSEPRLAVARGAAKLLASDTPAPSRWPNLFRIGRRARGAFRAQTPLAPASMPEATRPARSARSNELIEILFATDTASPSRPIAPKPEDAGVRS